MQTKPTSKRMLAKQSNNKFSSNSHPKTSTQMCLFLTSSIWKRKTLLNQGSLLQERCTLNAKAARDTPGLISLSWK